MTEQQMNADMAEAEEAAADLAKVAKIGSEEMANKVAKLLRQAESLPEDSPEREVFMDRVLTLSQAYSISLSYARSLQAKKEKVEEVEERNFRVGDYRGSRVAGNTKWLNELMQRICDANDVKYLMSSNGVRIFAHGFPSDLDMVERLFAVLSVEMVSSVDAALKRGDHKVTRRVPVTRREEIAFEDRDWGGYDRKSQRFYDDRDEWLDYNTGEPKEEPPEEVWSWSMNGGQGGYRKPFPPPAYREVPVLDAEGNPTYEERVVSSVDGRVWRANAYQGFIAGIADRLRKAKKQALKDAGIDMTDESDSGALVLRDKKKEVKEEFDRVVLATKPGVYKGAQTSGYDDQARQHGLTAAERARLGDEHDVARSSKKELG